MDDEKTPKRKKRLIFWVVLFVFCCLVAATCVGVLSYHIVLDRMMNDLYEQARIVGTESQNDGQDGVDRTNGVQNEYDDSIADEIVTIDFDLLKQTSADVYAWIEIPGTDVAYPIVQHPTNNNYYLRRAINGSYDVTGCIFTENLNNKNFSDQNTVIYGHYMVDGSKFGILLNYSDAGYFNNHRKIVIYTETQKLTYKVFAALPFNTRHVLSSYRFCRDPFSQFIADVNATKDARTVIADDINVDIATDKIVTLSTCMKTNSKRFLVLAVLTDSQYCS